MSNLESIDTLSAVLISELLAAGKLVSTAESCTGGWIAKSLTDNSGSSGCFGYGLVSYSNSAKESLLGVNPATLKHYGAISEAVVKEMAEGALNLSGADIAAAVSGVAEPKGSTEEKPVGTVWFAWATRNKNKSNIYTEKRLLKGERDQIRAQTVIIALQGIREHIRE
jgi:nicotinamide-nucleotide amidase